MIQKWIWERVPQPVCGFALSSAQPSLRPQNAQSNAQKYSNFRKKLMGPPTKRHEKASAVQKLMKQKKPKFCEFCITVEGRNQIMCKLREVLFWGLIFYNIE
jgi:hypothetical protein